MNDALQILDCLAAAYMGAQRGCPSSRSAIALRMGAVLKAVPLQPDEPARICAARALVEAWEKGEQIAVGELHLTARYMGHFLDRSEWRMRRHFDADQLEQMGIGPAESEG